MTEVQKIMNAHLGQIEISSEVDKGTYVSLIFYR
jgi:signal transduction histidine kinase